jgi:hypothetical protein
MNHPPPQSPGNSPPAPESPFTRALETATFDPLAGSPVGRLLTHMSDRGSDGDLVPELQSLRLLLYRLLTEQYDLPSLVPLVTRVVEVSLQAARTNHRVHDGAAADVLDAVTVILQELTDKP